MWMMLSLAIFTSLLDSMLPCICSVIDHSRRQNVVRTSVTHSPAAFCSYHILMSFSILLNRCKCIVGIKFRLKKKR